MKVVGIFSLCLCGCVCKSIGVKHELLVFFLLRFVAGLVIGQCDRFERENVCLLCNVCHVDASVSINERNAVLVIGIYFAIQWLSSLCCAADTLLIRNIQLFGFL